MKEVRTKSAGTFQFAIFEMTKKDEEPGSVYCHRHTENADAEIRFYWEKSLPTHLFSRESAIQSAANWFAREGATAEEIEKLMA